MLKINYHRIEVIQDQIALNARRIEQYEYNLEYAQLSRAQTAAMEQVIELLEDTNKKLERLIAQAETIAEKNNIKIIHINRLFFIIV